MGQAALLFRLAIRNLGASRTFLAIGAIIAAATTVLVSGSILLDAVDQSMSRSVTGSISGHVQIYSARAKDDLTLWGDYTEALDLSAIDDFEKVKASLSKVDNVQAIVPMGVDRGDVLTGNLLDRRFETLRQLAKQRAAGHVDPRDVPLEAHVRQLVKVLHDDLTRTRALLDPRSLEARNFEALERANSDAFWAQFDADPFNALEFLENRIAPLVPEAEPLHMDFIGTDFAAYRAHFDRMEIVDGQPVPDGKPGILLSKYWYEEKFKLKNARRLDTLRAAIHQDGRRIADDPELRQWVSQNVRQTREIVLQLDAVQTREAITALQGELHASETSLEVLLQRFFDTTDQNFDERYAFFYETLAPMLDLYLVPVGKSLTVKTYLKSGLTRAVNLRLYGTVQFKGLENSPLSSGLNLMDLESFRTLYGYQTPEQLAETRALIAESGAANLESENLDALFESTPAGRPEPGRGPAVSTFTARNPVVNAAIVLRDPDRLDETLAALQAKAKQDRLDLKIVAWRDSCGLVGQLVTLAKLVLYFAASIVALVSLIFVNNAIMTSMLARIRELGTLRAMGAPRSLILRLVVLEALLLGLGGCFIGCVLGGGLMLLIGHHGIAASNQVLYLLFSGPSLRPTPHLDQFIGAFVLVLLVTAVSTLYPALTATRIAPVRAMQTDE